MKTVIFRTCQLLVLGMGVIGMITMYNNPNDMILSIAGLLLVIPAVVQNAAISVIVPEKVAGACKRHWTLAWIALGPAVMIMIGLATVMSLNTATGIALDIYAIPIVLIALLGFYVIGTVVTTPVLLPLIWLARLAKWIFEWIQVNYDPNFWQKYWEDLVSL